MKKRGKYKRKCKACGKKIEDTQLWLCPSCQSTGTMYYNTKKMIDARELRRVALARQAEHKPPLEDMSMAEINELAWEYGGPYNTYGKFREYVRQTGQLPPVQEGKANE